MERKLSRDHRVLGFSVLVLFVVSLVLTIGVPFAAAADSEERGVLDQGTFQDPGPQLRPGFIWWWPGAAVEDQELRAEQKEMAATGFGSAQLLEAPRLGLPREGNPPETYMWGTQFWAERIKTVLQAGREDNFPIDLQASSGWPWTSPAVAGANAELSAQNLGFAQRAVTGPSTFVGPPPMALDANDRRLVAVTAARRDPAGTDSQGRVLLDANSTIDLTSKLDKKGNVRWQVPPGEWVLFGFWRAPTRSAGALGNGFGYVIDYLNPKSTAAATKYLDDHLFRYLGSLPREAGATFHEDSLEGFFRFDPKQGFFPTLWTPDFLSEFRSRRGYELRRYLPALALNQNGFGFTFPGEAGERVRHDYAQTLTELWIDNHVIPTRRWAHRHGLEASGRVFGADEHPLDVVEVTKAYDVPDIDHITNSTIDWARTLTSGARLAGNNLVYSELGDLIGADYMITLDNLKRLGDRQMIGGANQLELHGYPYKFAHGARWPSWWPWSSEYPPVSGVSEGFTPNIPLWRDLPRLADYFARAQTVLRAGKPITDVAIYRDAQGYKLAPIEVEGESQMQSGDGFEPLVDSALTRSGFSFDVVNPATIEDPATRFQGHRLVVQRPGYKALVVDLEGSREIGTIDNSDAMAATVARRLVGLAGAGLPIVFVGQFPSRGVSYRNAGAEDTQLRTAVAKLERSPNVRLAAAEADVPAALAELEVEPDLELEGVDRSPEPCGFGAQCVYSVHRHTDKGDYWFLWNGGKDAVDFTGSFAVSGKAPRVWDLWSGENQAVGLYRESGERVEVPIELAPQETVVVGFDQRVKRHVVATSAERVIVDNGDLYLRSTDGGETTATLSDGRNVAVELPQLPAAIEPTSWQLHVDGAVAEGEETHDLSLTALADWRQMPELENTSGVGTYRTTVTLAPDWVGDGRGAYLELGRIEGGGVEVRVNGTLVDPRAVVSSRLDVGPFLRDGDNLIEVEVATTLKNRLHEMSTRVDGYQRFADSPTQPYGLIGPVSIVPYAEGELPPPRHHGGGGGSQSSPVYPRRW